MGGRRARRRPARRPSRRPARPGRLSRRRWPAASAAGTYSSKRSSKVPNNCRRRGARTAPPGTKRSPTSTVYSIDPAGREALDQLDTQLRGEVAEWAELVHAGKRWAADTILRSEVLRIEREISATSTRRATGGVTTCPTPSPRSPPPCPCTGPTCPSATSICTRRPPTRCGGARTSPARSSRSWPCCADPSHPAARRFQQTSGMIMAKGVEDRAFYQYSRLTSLTEVGGEPSEFSIDVDEFHRRQQRRIATYPATATTLEHPRHEARRGRARPARRVVGDPAPLGGDVAGVAGPPSTPRPLLRTAALAGRHRRVADLPRTARRLRPEGGARGRALDHVVRP